MITTPRGSLTPLILLGGVIVVAALGVDFIRSGPLAVGAKQITVAIGGLAVLLCGVVLALPVQQRNIGDWLLVGLSVIAVGMAADLLTIVEQPKIEFKLLMLAAVGFSLLLNRAVLILADKQPADDAWPRLLTLVKENIGKFLGVAIQLGLLSLVIRQYHIENQLFWHSVTLLIFYGFLLLLSFTPISSYVFSFALSSGSRGDFRASERRLVDRVGSVPHRTLSPASFLSLARRIAPVVTWISGGDGANWIQNPWSGAIWPILGSNVTFRLIVYMYHLRHQKEPISVSRTLSYFFLLPSICFPLFPVVDYKTFCRTYYDDEEHLIY